MKDLPDGACDSEFEILGLKQGGWYNIYIVDIVHDNYDEYTTLEVTCKLDKEYEKCKGWLKSTVQNISLEVNGIRQDGQFTREHVSEGNVMKFTATLEYEFHYKANFSCVSDSEYGAKLLSWNKTLPRLDELHKYTITPETSHVTIGESFALTCKTDSVRGLNTLRWKTRINDEGSYVTLNGKTAAGLNHVIRKSVDNLYSVLNVTSVDFGGITSRLDYNFNCAIEPDYHSKSQLYRGVATVTIHPEDNSLQNMAIGGGASILAMAIIFIALLRRRRNLKSSLSVVSKENFDFL